MRGRGPGVWFVLVWAASACSVPELDTSVAIECSADRNCPAGHECRVGRCCASSLGATQCPIVPAGTAGAPCAGRVCQITEGTGVAVQGTCFEASPRGYCSAECTVASPRCGDYARCAPTQGGAGRCVRRCHFVAGALTPCRNGPGDGNAPAGSYLCVKDPNDTSATAGLCVPDCVQYPGFCGAAEVCDTTQRRCVSMTPSSCREDPFVCMPQGLVCEPLSGRCGPCTVNAALCLAYGRTCNTTTQRCQ